MWLAGLGGIAVVTWLIGWRRGYVEAGKVSIPIDFDPGIFSRWFTPDEVSKSQTAMSQGINNTPDSDSLMRASIFSQFVLDPISDYIGKKANITSWYRSPALNTAVGGSSTSDHMRGESADIDEGDNLQILYAITEWLIPFDQLIIYPTDGNYKKPRYVHISYDATKLPDEQKNTVLIKNDSTGAYEEMSFLNFYNEFLPGDF